MAGLLYREDMDAVRARLKTWWEGGDIGRPAMSITVPRNEPIERIPVMPEPAGWVTDYSTSNFDYRVNLAARQCVNTHFLAEAVPCVSPDLAPNCLALYLGCKGVDMPGTVWCEPVGSNIDDLHFDYDPDNFYWRFTKRLGREATTDRSRQVPLAVPRPDRRAGYTGRHAWHRTIADGPDRAPRMDTTLLAPDHGPLFPLLRRPV